MNLSLTLSLLDDNAAVFVSQLMTFFPLMMTRKTLGTGLIASGRNTMIKNTPRPRDSQPHLLGGKEARVNERKRKKSEAAGSCTKGCRRSTRNIWLVQLAKRRRLGVARSSSMMKGARRPFRVAPRQAAQSWASMTSPGRLREARSRRWSRSCCMVWTERTYRRFVKRFESSKRCGTPINSLSDVKLDWRRRTNRRSWIQSPLCHRSSTDWLRVWRLENHTMNIICADAQSWHVGWFVFLPIWSKNKLNILFYCTIECLNRHTWTLSAT